MILHPRFLKNILDSQPTLQRPNLSWQQDSVPDRKVWAKHIPQKMISLRTHADPELRHRRSTKIYFWASLGCLFCPYVRKLETFVSGVSRLWASQAQLSEPASHPSNLNCQNSLKYLSRQ